MRKIASLALLALSTSITFADLPTTQPRPIDEAEVSRLVRQLEHPAVKNRDEAAKALEEMGKAVVPLLEKAAESAPFEAKARIEEILRPYRQPLAAVIVCKVAADTQAVRLGIKPGDIITHLQGQPIHNYAEFERAAEALQNQSRSITIRSGNERRTLTLEPGAIGVWLGNYDDAYGPPLVAALQAFAQDRTIEARDRMTDAVKAGMVFHSSDCRHVIYAMSTYLSGDSDGAKAMLVNWAARSRQPWPWAHLSRLLPEYHAGCKHLRRFVCKRQVDAAGSTDWNLYSAREVCEVGRSIEGIVLSLEAASGPSDGLSDYENRERFESLCGGFHDLGLGPEVLQAISGASDRYMTREWMAFCAVMAESLDRPDLSLKLDKELFRRESAELYHGGAASEIIRLELEAGHEAAASAFIQQLTPEEAAQALVYVSPALHRWTEARPAMVELARLALRHDKPSERALVKAVAALELEEHPDPAELESILTRAQAATTPRPATTLDDYDRFSYTIPAAQISLAMVRGEYDAAEKILTQFNPPFEKPEYVRHAITFVKTHHSTLSGDREPWRRTVAAYPLKTGGCLLLTRDQRLGCASADAKIIRDIPPPQKRWEPLSHAAALLNTRGEKGILATSNETVYLLNDDRTAWEPLARLPEYYSWWRLETFSAAFDNLIPLLRSHGDGAVRIVEPDILWATSQRLVSFMLSDGTWLSCDTRAGTVWQPREIAGRLLGEQIDIYAVFSPARDDLRAFVCTNRGLLDWRPAEGTMQRLDLPTVDKLQPVTSTYEGATPPEGAVRIALFPNAGGTTFLVDTATGRVRLEGCVSESYPMSYWRQKPAEEKRDLLNKALREANLKYPWATTAPAVN